MATNELAKTASQEQDEIDEIMKEIKNLQESINNVQTQKPAAPKLRAVEAPAPTEAEAEAELAEFRPEGGSEGSSLEETMATMKGDPDAKTLFDEEPETAPAPAAEIEEEIEAPSAAAAKLSTADEELADAIEDLAEDTSSASAEEGALSMTLTGKMALKLKYAFNGNEVSIRFQDESLVVSLTDGTELKIPLRRGNRRVA